MNTRVLRVLEAVELFALVIWVGSLFCINLAVAPALYNGWSDELMVPDKVFHAIYSRYAPLELVVSLLLLATAFVKARASGPGRTLQRLALLAAAILATIALLNLFLVQPHLVNRLHSGGEYYLREFRGLLSFQLFLGLFLVYAHRAYEEDKLLSLSRLILRGPGGQ